MQAEPELSGIQTAGEIDATSDANKSSLGVTDAFFGVPDVEDSSVLPDLGQNHEITSDNILNQPLEAVSTEEEFDAADTLLSLSNVRDTFNLDLGDGDDNSLLMLIGGSPAVEDVAPEPLRLGQIEVDGEIAKMLTVNEHEELKNDDNLTDGKHANTLLGVSVSESPTAPPVENKDKDTVIEPNTTELPGVPDKTSGFKPVEKSTDDVTEEPDKLNDQLTDIHKGARPKTVDKESDSVVTKKGSRGAFRSQLYGLR